MLLFYLLFYLDPAVRPTFVEITSQLLQVMRTMPSVQVSSPKTPPRDPPFPPPPFLRASSSKAMLVSSDSTEDLTPFGSPTPSLSSGLQGVAFFSPSESIRLVSSTSVDTFKTHQRSNSESEKVQLVSHCMLIIHFFVFVYNSINPQM